MKKHIILSLAALSLTSNIASALKAYEDTPASAEFKFEDAKVREVVYNGDKLTITFTLPGVKELPDLETPKEEEDNSYSFITKAAIGGTILLGTGALALAVDHYYFAGAGRGKIFDGAKFGLEKVGLKDSVAPLYRSVRNFDFGKYMPDFSKAKEYFFGKSDVKEDGKGK